MILGKGSMLQTAPRRQSRSLHKLLSRLSMQLANRHGAERRPFRSLCGCSLREKAGILAVMKVALLLLAVLLFMPAPLWGQEAQEEPAPPTPPRRPASAPT